MPRYFIELAYKGTQYSGFQIQPNAVTVQQKVEEAFRIFFKREFAFTGSSRTDAGVHAEQNYFHFDTEDLFDRKHVYNLNALLPADIVIKRIAAVQETAHARFDAIARHYRYCIYQTKNPFLDDRGWYLPFKLDHSVLHQCAELVTRYTNFIAFSKVHSQVKTFDCNILYSRWTEEGDCLVYEVAANRFLRGMVRGLTGTMVKVARGNLSFQDFEKILREGEQASADFSAPAKGLFLKEVVFPDAIFRPESL